MHRVLGQARGVVAVGVAAGDPVDALPHQLDHLVLDLAGLPVVDQTGRQPLGDPQAVVQRLEQHRPAIRARVGLVEPGDDGLPKPLELEGHLGYTGCSHRASSRVGVEASGHRFYSTDEGLGGCFVSSFAHNPGFPKLGRLLTRHLDGILNYCDEKVPFGTVEAINGNILAMLRRGRGYRDHEYLLLKVHRATATRRLRPAA